MSTMSMETFIDVIASNHIESDANFFTAEVDLKGYRGVIFALNITEISLDDVALQVHDSLTTGGTFTVALQPDGVTEAATTAAGVGTGPIEDVGLFYVRVLAENVRRFCKLQVTMAADGIAAACFAIRFGPDSETKPTAVEGTVGDYQILLPA